MIATRKAIRLATSSATTLTDRLLGHATWVALYGTLGTLLAVFTAAGVIR